MVPSFQRAVQMYLGVSTSQVLQGDCCLAFAKKRREKAFTHKGRL